MILLELSGSDTHHMTAGKLLTVRLVVRPTVQRSGLLPDEMVPCCVEQEWRYLPGSRDLQLMGERKGRTVIAGEWSRDRIRISDAGWLGGSRPRYAMLEMVYFVLSIM